MQLLQQLAIAFARRLCIVDSIFVLFLRRRQSFLDFPCAFCINICVINHSFLHQDGDTVLIHAASEGCLEDVRLFLEVGADKEVHNRVR